MTTTATDWQPTVRAETGHHPLAWCEHCGKPVPGVLVDCEDPECQRKALELEMYFVRLDDR